MIILLLLSRVSFVAFVIILCIFKQQKLKSSGTHNIRIFFFFFFFSLFFFFYLYTARWRTRSLASCWKIKDSIHWPSPVTISTSWVWTCWLPWSIQAAGEMMYHLDSSGSSVYSTALYHRTHPWTKYLGHWAVVTSALSDSTSRSYGSCPISWCSHGLCGRRPNKSCYPPRLTSIMCSTCGTCPASGKACYRCAQPNARMYACYCDCGATSYNASSMISWPAFRTRTGSWKRSRPRLRSS